MIKVNNHVFTYLIQHPSHELNFFMVSLFQNIVKDNVLLFHKAIIQLWKKKKKKANVWDWWAGHTIWQQQHIYINYILCQIISPPLTKEGGFLVVYLPNSCDIRSILSRVKQVWIKNFASPRLVATPRDQSTIFL